MGFVLVVFLFTVVGESLAVFTLLVLMTAVLVVRVAGVGVEHHAFNEECCSGAGRDQ